MGPRGVGKPPHSSLPPPRPPDSSQFKLKLQAHKEEVAARFSKLDQSLTTFAAEHEEFQRELREELRQLRLSYSNPATTVSTSPSSLITGNPSSPNYCQLPEPPPIPNCKPQPQILDPTPPASFTLKQAVTNPTHTHIVTATTPPQILPQIHHSPNVKPHKMKFKFGRVHRNVRIQFLVTLKRTLSNLPRPMGTHGRSNKSRKEASSSSSKSRCRRKLDDSEFDSYTGSGDFDSPDSSPVRSSGKRKERKKIERDVSQGVSLDMFSVKAQKQSQTSGDSKSTWVNHWVKYHRCKSQKQFLGRFYHRDYGPITFVSEIRVSKKCDYVSSIILCFAVGYEWSRGGRKLNLKHKCANRDYNEAFETMIRVIYDRTFEENGKSMLIQFDRKDFDCLWGLLVRGFKMTKRMNSVRDKLVLHGCNVLSAIAYGLDKKVTEVVEFSRDSMIENALATFWHCGVTLMASLKEGWVPHSHGLMEMWVKALIGEYMIIDLPQCLHNMKIFHQLDDTFWKLVIIKCVIVVLQEVKKIYYLVQWAVSWVIIHFGYGFLPFLNECVAHSSTDIANPTVIVCGAKDGHILPWKMATGNLDYFNLHDLLDLDNEEAAHNALEWLTGLLRHAAHLYVGYLLDIPEIIVAWKNTKFGLVFYFNVSISVLDEDMATIRNTFVSANSTTALRHAMWKVMLLFHGVCYKAFPLFLFELAPPQFYEAKLAKEVILDQATLLNVESAFFCSVEMESLRVRWFVEQVGTGADSRTSKWNCFSNKIGVLDMTLVVCPVSATSIQPLFHNLANFAHSLMLELRIHGCRDIFGGLHAGHEQYLIRSFVLDATTQTRLLANLNDVVVKKGMLTLSSHKLLICALVMKENIVAAAAEYKNSESFNLFVYMANVNLGLDILMPALSCLHKCKKIGSSCYNINEDKGIMLFDEDGQMPNTNTVHEVDCQLQDGNSLLALLKQNLYKAQERIKLFHDKRHTERTFEVGDLVYMKLQSYKQQSVEKRTVHKLLAKYYGPSEEIERIGTVAYKLKLPASASIHTAKVINTMRVKRKGQALAKWLIKWNGLLLKLLMGSLLKKLWQGTWILTLEEEVLQLKLEDKLFFKAGRVVRDQNHINYILVFPISC